MKFTQHLQATWASLRALLLGLSAYVLVHVRKKEAEQYCQVCQVLEKPLQLGRYMIRTGPRAGALLFDVPHELSVYVCNRHHPDTNMEGAVWAKETQDFLKQLHVAAQCVYLYHHHRQ